MTSPTGGPVRHLVSGEQPSVGTLGRLGAAAGHAAKLLPRCTFPPPGRMVTCAVSGGADSCALAILAVAAGCAVRLVHVDHGLRAGSDREADAVRELAARLGVGFRAETVAVKPGRNLEARARAARYGVLPPAVLTGHTADDRAETVVINLLRGTGVEGLAGIRPRPERPLLALRRAETAELCRLAGLAPFEDPSNADRRFLRNRVRSEVLPLLCAVAGRDVVPLLCRQADHALAAAQVLRSLSAEVDPTDTVALAAQPRAVVEVALREWLRSGNDERHPPDAATIARLLEVVGGRAKATEVGAGRTVRRSGGRLRLEGPREAGSSAEAATSAGVVGIPPAGPPAPS